MTAMLQSRAARRFFRNRPALAGLLVLTLLTGACGATLAWSAQAMSVQDLSAVRQAPSWQHPLGTDDLGRSLLARTLFGGAISLGLGLLAAAVAVGIGAGYGLLAGYFGGRVDAIMMRIVDVLYALPSLLLVMLLTVSLGAWLERAAWPGGGANATTLGSETARIIVLALGIGGVSWLTVARVIRGQVLLLREQAYVEACRALGLPLWRTLLVHIAPNLVGPLMVFAALTVPQAILQESFLSFLGVGIQPPQASWGSLAADGIRALTPIDPEWWRVVTPCVTLALTLLALNFVGEGLRAALDARTEPRQ